MPLFSNLNLNASVPPRVRPNIGEWGPESVVGTKTKRRRRWLAVGAFVLAALAVTLLGYWAWHAMTGLWGFGID